MKRRTSRKLRSNRRRSAITSRASKPRKIKFHWPPAIDYDTRVALGLPVHGGKSRRTSRKLRSNSRRGTSIRRNSGTEPKVYCTSYCNFGHNMKTGRPIGHECRVIPPAALRAERAGDYGEAQRILSGKLRANAATLHTGWIPQPAPPGAKAPYAWAPTRYEGTPDEIVAQYSADSYHPLLKFEVDKAEHRVLLYPDPRYVGRVHGELDYKGAMRKYGNRVYKGLRSNSRRRSSLRRNSAAKKHYMVVASGGMIRCPQTLTGAKVVARKYGGDVVTMVKGERGHKTVYRAPALRSNSRRRRTSRR